MLNFRLPRKLRKSAKPQVDPVRALRIIRIQANIIILLILALIGGWLWFSRIRNSVDLHAIAQDFDPPIRVNLVTKIFSGETNITSSGITGSPFVTFYGQVQDYGLLRDALQGFGVTVRGTRVDIKPENGEFTEKIVLQAGKNTIDLALWWEGVMRQRQNYTITYIPTRAISTSAQN